MLAIQIILKNFHAGMAVDIYWRGSLAVILFEVFLGSSGFVFDFKQKSPLE